VSDFFRDDLFAGIMGRKEVEEFLKVNDLHNIVLISILNLVPVEKVYEELKKEIESGKEKIEVFFVKNGKVKNKIVPLNEAKEFLNSKSYLLQTKDYNYFPLKEELKSGLKDFLEIRFWDIEEKIRNYYPIDKDSVKKLLEFVKKHKRSFKLKKTKLLIHCSAGISRSAAVGMAMRCIIDYDGDVSKMKNCGILTHPRYKPNMFVFKNIVKHYKDVNKN